MVVWQAVSKKGAHGFSGLGRYGSYPCIGLVASLVEEVGGQLRRVSWAGDRMQVNPDTE